MINNQYLFVLFSVFIYSYITNKFFCNAIVNFNPDTTYVLHLCKNGWDYSYQRELFPENKYSHVELQDFEANYKDNPQIKPRIFVYNIENSGADAKYTIVEDLIKKYKPIILVHTADEYQGSPRKYKYGEGVELYHYAPLVLRQYSIFPYRSFDRPYANVVQLPLGYMQGMLEFDNKTLTSTEAVSYSLARTSKERTNNWSFIGAMQGHPERKSAIEIFEKWYPYETTYGRGQANLDCFRIYEAIVSGSIPIVVGSLWERERVFEHEGDFPPFLFADNYDQALEICKKMTDDEIDLKRKENVYWFINRTNRIIKKIELFLTVFPN